MKVIRRLVAFKFRLVITLTLCLLAVYVAGGRYLFSTLPDYHDDLQAILTYNLDKTVSFDSIEGDWSGFDPEIRINGVRIEDGSHASIEQVTLRVGFLASIMALEPRMKSIEFFETRVRAEQMDGAWKLAGYELSIVSSEEASSPSDVDPDVVRRFLNGANISFIETHIISHAMNRKERDWRLPTISLNYYNNEVYGSGLLVHGERLEPVMNFSLHGSGVLSEEPVDAQIYLEARSLNFLDELFEAYQWQGLHVSSLDASGRLWANFIDLKPSSVRGDVQIRSLGWQHEQVEQMPLSNLATQFLWQTKSRAASESSESSLQLSGLSWNWAGQRCHVNNAMLSSRSQLDAELQLYQAYLDNLDVACVSQMVVDTKLINGRLYERLNTSQPSGHLQNVLVEWQRYRPNQKSSAPLSSRSLSSGGAPLDANTVEFPNSQLDAPESVASESVVSASDLSADTQESQLNESSRFRLQANLSDLALAAYDGTPSGKHINGYLFADDSGGQVHLSSDGFELGFPDLFLEPFVTQRAQGIVSWALDGDDVRIQSDGLRLYMPDGWLVYGDFGLLLNPDEDEDYLDLALAVQDIPFPQVTKLVPYYSIDTEVYDWLDAALQAGRVPEAVYYGYGSVESNSADNSFTSSLRVKTDDGVLKFDEAWPALEALNASLTLQDDAFELSTKSAVINKTRLKDVQAIMPSTPKGVPSTLFISAGSRVDEPQIDYWLGESPLAEDTSEIARSLDINGEVDIDLNLEIPFSDEDVAYKVVSTFAGNKVRHNDSDLEFRGLKGKLVVSDKEGVVASGMSLNFLQRPATLDISSPRSKAGDFASTRLDMSGSAEVEQVLDRLGIGAVEGLDGELEYQAQLSIPYDAQSAVGLTITSDQVGVVRDWPAPLTKLANQAEPLNIDLDFQSNYIDVDALVQVTDQRLLDSQIGAGTQASVETNHQVKARLHIPNKGALVAALALNDQGALPSNQSLRRDPAGITINASQVTADLGEWLEFVDRFSSSLESSQSNGSNSEGADLRKIMLLDLDLDAWGQGFDGLNVDLENHPTGWLVTVRGEQVSGHISLPTDVRLLSLNLDHLYLNGSEDEEDEASEDEATDLHPRDIPELSFRVDKLVFDGVNYGAWSTDFKHHDQGVRFNDISGGIGDASIEGFLNWQVQDGQASSYLELALAGKDVENIFKQLGKTAPLSSDKITGEVALVWLAPPHEFSADKVSGRVTLTMEDGFLNTPDSQTGALRLLGIFNAEALGRRLKLDFSDIYKSGISYDNLDMTAAIDVGRLRFEPPMEISGPSSSYEIKGTTDLGKQTLDLDMNVALPVTSNVPLAALMLGAPQVGGAVWLVDKLLGEPLSSITSVDYKVRGTWDNPKIDIK